MDICILASSSSGNCTAIRSNGKLILLDAGLSGKEIERRLSLAGWSASEISALVLTHEHTDHVKGAGILARRFGIPVYGTAGTFAAASSCWKGKEKLHEVRAAESFTVGDLICEPFVVSHDVAEPVQYVFRNERMSFGIATDLGKVTTLVAQKLSTTDVAVIEANHDVKRLRWGDYPWKVKQRIAGQHGHLNNEQAGELAVELVGAGVRHIILAHLSPNHNDRETAREAVSAALDKAGLKAELTVIGSRDESIMIHQSSAEQTEMPPQKHTGGSS